MCMVFVILCMVFIDAGQELVYNYPQENRLPVLFHGPCPQPSHIISKGAKLWPIRTQCGSLTFNRFESPTHMNTIRPRHRLRWPVPTRSKDSCSLT